MFDKMLVFLSLILSIEQAKSCKKYHPVLKRTDLEDCTQNFTNRIASFESGNYPGYWMYPDHNVPAIYSTPTASVKTDKTYQWFLHDCGTGKVCLEPKREGWEEYYMHHSTDRYNPAGYQGVDPPEWYWELILEDTDFYNGSNEKKQTEIWCTSCTPERDNLTYSDCQLVASEPVEQEMLHPRKTSRMHVVRGRQGSSDAFMWRILSPQTRQYWETAVAADNCDGQEDLPASYTVTSSIERTTSTTLTTTISAKISFGREAVKVLQLLGGEAGISHSWSSSSTTAAAEGRSITLGSGSRGKIIRPRRKWIVKQLVGEVGYTKIKSLEHKSIDSECT